MKEPLIFWLGHALIRHRIRGGHRLLATMRPRWRNRSVDYSLSTSVRFTVPIGRRDTCWDIHDLQSYETKFIERFSDLLRPLSNVTLFDCGADIGLFSASVCARVNNIGRVIAFEPNPECTDVFMTNISRLPRGQPLPIAVSDFCGFGELMRPDYDTSDHARFLVRAAEGIPVSTIDSLNVRSGDLAIKIDVEGGELGVLRGAAATIQNASRAVIAFEAHPCVVSRTQVHPRECMQFLEQLRSFRFTIAETGQLMSLIEESTI